jgi:hypothetical protein
MGDGDVLGGLHWLAWCGCPRIIRAQGVERDEELWITRGTLENVFEREVERADNGQRIMPFLVRLHVDALRNVRSLVVDGSMRSLAMDG